MAIGYIKDKDSGTPEAFQFSVNLKTIDGYIPKNNKCFCSPYNTIVLTNNSGAKITFSTELLNDLTKENNKITIYYNCIVSANPSVFCYVSNYQGLSLDFSRAIAFNNFPAIPYTYDFYSNWLALNKNTITTQYIQQSIGLTSSLLSGNASGAVSGTLGLASQEASQADMRNRPDTMNGVPQGNDLLYSGSAGIYVSQVTCRKEYISIIDDYFTRYGYQINAVKKPLLKNRKNFDYIKTSDMNLSGGIPTEDLEELCSIFDNGLTIWHNPKTFGDYLVDNSTI